jgi:hypothetical protein
MASMISDLVGEDGKDRVGRKGEAFIVGWWTL